MISNVGIRYSNSGGTALAQGVNMENTSTECGLTAPIPERW